MLTWTFVAQLGWGMKGAALGTGIAWLIGMLVLLRYFCNQENTLHFVRPLRELRILGKAAYNGASEMVNASSASIVAIIFNLQLMRHLGESGVVAYAVGEYVMGLFMAMLDGICISIVPVVGYHFGAGNYGELGSLRRKGILLVGGIGVLMTASSAGLADVIAGIFVGYDESLKTLAAEALRYLSLHHTISDGTSLGVLLEDIAKAYRQEELEPDYYYSYILKEHENKKPRNTRRRNNTSTTCCPAGNGVWFPPGILLPWRPRPERNALRVWFPCRT
ncbi:MAG: hypothetical protein IJT01_10230 [Selenomonadaceae bacterium]|nr:hypothetical protein [Selenomonadaceae bacterium]